MLTPLLAVGDKFIRAVLAGDVAEAERLIVEDGAAVDSVARNGLTALYAAAHRNNAAMALMLLEHGAAVDGPLLLKFAPLHIAAARSARLVQVLLDAGAFVDPANGKSTTRATPLHIASARVHLAAMEALLLGGADVNARTADLGWTPLHYAASRGCGRATALLLNARASVDRTDRRGHSALVACIRSPFDCTDSARVLLAYGALICEADVRLARTLQKLNLHRMLQGALRSRRVRLRSPLGYVDLKRW